METPAALLKLESISKSFGGVQALNEVSLELLPGEVHALLGENGAGKSTLIKTITGIHSPDSGRILLEGRAVHWADTRAAQRHGIAAIYQEPSLFPDLDIAENILAGRQPTRGGRVDWRQMYEQAGQLLRRLGVALDPRTKARDLSMAQQQLVEIARALSLHARVLIMDEPTSALTPGEVEELFVIVRQLRQEGTAILFISHRLEELFALADRVSILRDGSYVGTRPMAGVSSQELIQMMVGRRLDELYPKQVVEPGEVVLETRGLSLPGCFSDITLSLRRGEILGVAGLIGAGRTALARVLFGLERPSAGSILLRGTEISIRRPSDAMALGIAYVPEDRKQHGLILELSVGSNITLPGLRRFARFGWLDRQRERREAQLQADRLQVKLAGVSQRAGQLSGGNQQKVVLAKWLATQPEVLILDEPTRGIDVGTKAAVHRLISSLAAQGLAILLISSELPEVLGMSDRILVMREGRLAGEFSRAEASQELLMQAATQPVLTGAGRLR